MAKGFADPHNRQFANLGSGGLTFWGSPSGPIDRALPWCTPAHGPGGIVDLGPGPESLDGHQGISPVD